MQVYRGLWRKEISMMQGFHIVSGLLLVIVILWSIITYNDSTSYSDLGILAYLTYLHLTIMPATILFSLNMEVHQLSLLLFQKQKVAKTIHIKFLHGFSYSIIYLLFLILLLYCFKVIGVLEFSNTTLMKIVGLSLIFTGTVSMIMSVLIYVAWVIHQWLRFKLGFLLSIVSLGLISYLCLKYSTPFIAFIERSRDFWTIDIDGHTELQALASFLGNQHSISISYILVILCLLIVLYGAFTWLLKEKVEV
ncbi:hypothetical protein J416_06787 [Gracilibacillus halophilus YIM-C55.5]|uniref:Uncharacterized protein n=1 Tax=Gracilibacillus halophilus YIM-C55.5 TaxID=1308866 RepID=N4WRX4_9BACI|nr:hypothetical protein [Gracilibacillus halophilus]ENH97135.1 hypothetical protein J416_06787 [Gracilibacillus halophilus YIM-C55.5]